MISSYKPDFRLLVVFDQSKAAHVGLQNAINFAKPINGAIDILYINRLSNVKKTENQVAFLRELEEERQRVKLEMQKLVNLISETEELTIIYSYTYGNLIEEVQKHIQTTDPDMVVIGRQKKRFLNSFNTRKLNQLRENYDGLILLSGEKNNLSNTKNLKLGFLDENEINTRFHLIQELIKKTKPVLNVFTVFNKTNVKRKSTPKKIIYEFEENGIVDSNITNYIHKNKIDLLCVRWGIKDSLRNFRDQNHKLTQKIIANTEAPILLLKN